MEIINSRHPAFDPRPRNRISGRSRIPFRPTLDLAKWVGYLDRAHDPASRTAFRALETWASDNIPFPGEAYRTYIQELYQANGLVNRTHKVRGKTVDLAAIRSRASVSTRLA